MKYTLSVFLRIPVSLFRARCRFVRISPNRAGKIYFFDKKNRRIFHIVARDAVDSNTADQIYKSHDYDLTFLLRYDELQAKYDKIIQDGQVPLIVDCGANIGLAARYFAEEFAKAQVVAIEPNKANCTMIRRNCEHLENVEVREAAIGSEAGFVEIDDCGADANSFRTVRTEGKNGIGVTTFNDILSEKTDYEPLIAKIDIEGFEDDLFSSSTGWVSKFPLIIVETHDWMIPRRAVSHNFLRVIAEHKRDFIHRGENVFSIAN